MKVKINISVEIEVGDKVSIPDITEQIESQELNKQALKNVVDAVDEAKTKEETGEKHKPDQTAQFSRAGTMEISVLSNFGRLQLTLNRIKATRGLFRKTKVVLEEISEAGDVQITEALKSKVRDTIVHTTYRRFSEIMDHLIGLGFKKDVIWGIVQEMGIRESETYKINPHLYDVVMVDGSGGKGKHAWYVFIGVNRKTGKMYVLHHSVGYSLSQIKTELKENGLLLPKHIIIADGERGIHTQFKEHPIQMCAFHFEQNLGYQLWSDGLTMNERKPYVKAIKEILSQLKNSVVSNAISKPDRLSKRIENTINQLMSIAEGLKFNGLKKAHNFIKRHLQTVTLFAREALNHIKIPWTNNMMERFIGEVTFRIKNRWAHWSKSGLNSIIHLIAHKFCLRNKFVLQF